MKPYGEINPPKANNAKEEEGTNALFDRVRGVQKWNRLYVAHPLSTRVYREDYLMSRSTAIRCLLLLGLKSVEHRAIDPKTKATFEGPTLPLLRFYKRGTVEKWFREGTSKSAKLKPVRTYQPTRLRRQPTKQERKAIVDRAVARSKASQP